MLKIIQVDSKTVTITTPAGVQSQKHYPAGYIVRDEICGYYMFFDTDQVTPMWTHVPFEAYRFELYDEAKEWKKEYKKHDKQKVS